MSPLLLAGALSCGDMTPDFDQESIPKRVQVGKIELHYIEEGAGEPLILLHGGQGDLRAWKPQMEFFRPHFRVISYSRRYHYPNKNRLDSKSHSALIEASDLAGFLKELHIKRAHFVGTSYGALTALAFAIDHPNAVSSLVLAEPPIHSWVLGSKKGQALYEARMKPAMERARTSFEAGQEAAAMEVFIDTFDGPGTFVKLPPEKKEVVLQNAAFFRALVASSDPFPNLPKGKVRRLAMPILLIHGEETDALHRFVVEEVSRVLNRARRASIPNAGHGSPRQNPTDFNAAVLGFLQEHKFIRVSQHSRT